MLFITVAYVIVHRTPSNRAAYEIRLGGVRNLIGRRTESDWAAYGIRQQNMMFRSAKVFIKHSYQRVCG